MVDEYDKPLLQAIGNKALQDDYRATLKSVYGVAKTMDGYIQMAFFTGVTKISVDSLFGDLNNITNISLDKHFSEICGFTEEEVCNSFDAEIGLMAKKNHLTIEECYAKLKENYDGYHFREDSVGVYNPFSLLNALQKMDFKDYWFETDTPSFLVETLKRNNYELENMTREEIEEIAFVFESNLFDDNPLSLLYQFGYLTINSYDQRFMGFQLKVPNSEAEHGLMEILKAF